MKRLIPILLLLLTMLLSGCGRGGNIRQSVRNVGASVSYSEAEINDVMDVVEDYFRKEFDGCTLKELSYDEEVSDKASGEWAAQYNADKAVVLTSTFDVDSSGGDGSLNPNSTYSGWQWILTQNDGDKWVLQTWGY